MYFGVISVFDGFNVVFSRLENSKHVTYMVFSAPCKCAAVDTNSLHEILDKRHTPPAFHVEHLAHQVRQTGKSSLEWKSERHHKWCCFWCTACLNVCIDMVKIEVMIANWWLTLILIIIGPIEGMESVAFHQKRSCQLLIWPTSLSMFLPLYQICIFSTFQATLSVAEVDVALCQSLVFSDPSNTTCHPAQPPILWQLFHQKP